MQAPASTSSHRMVSRAHLPQRQRWAIVAAAVASGCPSLRRGAIAVYRYRTDTSAASRRAADGCVTSPASKRLDRATLWPIRGGERRQQNTTGLHGNFPQRCKASDRGPSAQGQRGNTRRSYDAHDLPEEHDAGRPRYAWMRNAHLPSRNPLSEISKGPAGRTTAPAFTRRPDGLAPKGSGATMIADSRTDEIPHEYVRSTMAKLAGALHWRHQPLPRKSSLLRRTRADDVKRRIAERCHLRPASPQTGGRRRISHGTEAKAPRDSAAARPRRRCCRRDGRSTASRHGTLDDARCDFSRKRLAGGIADF